MSDAGIVIPVRIEGEGEGVLTLDALAKKLKEVGAAADDTKNKLKGSGDNLGDLQKKILGLVGTYVSFRAAIGFVSDSLKAQSEQEAAVNKLNLALANQGKLVGDTSKNLQEYASALQETTTFSDDAILQSEAILASFGANEEQIKKTTAAAADFAAATGTDLVSATNLLGKAFAGNTAALGRYGITVDQSLGKTQKFDAVISQLESRFGGSAQAATKTFEGAMKQLSNQWGEAQEAFGRFLATLIGGTSGFEGVINLVKRLTKFFGSDLIIALSEARALFAEFVGFLASKVATVLDVLGKLPDKFGGAGFREAAETARAVAQGQTELAAELREAGDAAAQSGGNFQTFTNNVDAAGNASALTAEQIKALAKATESANETIKKAQESIATGLATELERNLPAVDAAFAKIARESANAAQATRDAVAKAFKDVPGGVPPEIQQQLAGLEEGWRKVGDAQREAALDEARVRAFGDGLKEADATLLDIARTFELLGQVNPFAGQSSAQIATWAASVSEAAVKGSQEAAAKIAPAFGQALDKLIPKDIASLSIGALNALEEQLVVIEKNLRSVPALAKEWDTVATALGTVRSAQRDVYGEGLEEGEKVEKKTEDLSASTKVWGEAIQSVSALMSALGISADSTLGKILGSLGGITSGFQGLADGLKGLGAKAGGGLLSGLTGVLGKIGFAGQIATAAIGIGQSIVKLFQGDPIKKAQKEAGKILGTGISRELAEEIKKNADKLGIAVKDAALLALPKAIEESGKSAASFGNQIAELMSKVASGAIPAEEGIKAIGESFTKVADEAIKAGRVGDRVLVGLIKQSRALGLESPEIKAFTAEQLDKAVAGLTKFIDSLSAVSEEGFKTLGADAATIFGATFNALVSERGVIGAVDALGESFTALKEQLGKTLGAEAAGALLSPFSAAFDLLQNESLRPLVEGIDGLGQALTGLANSAFLDTGTFDAIQRSAGTLFDELIAGGADTRTALLTIAPTIQAAISAAEEFGVPLGEDTQRLKELAEQNGITFKTDPQKAMLDVLVSIADALGAKIPESVQKMRESVTGGTQAIASEFATVKDAAKAGFQAAVQQADAAGKGFHERIGAGLEGAKAAALEWQAAQEAATTAVAEDIGVKLPTAVELASQSWQTFEDAGSVALEGLGTDIEAFSAAFGNDVEAGVAAAQAALNSLTVPPLGAPALPAGAPGGVPAVPGAPGAPAAAGGAAAVQNNVTVNISENPFLTAETQEAMRRFTVAAVEEAVANLDTSLGG